MDILPITQDCKTIVGGLVDSIYIARTVDIDTMTAPATDTGPMTANITMKADKYFVPFKFVEDTASFKEDSGGDPGFRHLKSTLSCMIKGNKGATSRMLNGILNGSFVLIFKDAQDPQQTWVLGNKDKGANLGTKKDFGTKGEDKNHAMLEWTLTGNGAIVYTGTIPLAP